MKTIKPFKVKINFKMTRSKSYKSEIKLFNDQEDFDNWYKEQIQDESYRKILTFNKL